MEKIDKLNRVLANIDKTLEYYTEVFMPVGSGPMRIRKEALEVQGVLEYRAYVLEQIKELTPKPKRGNPNFGKNSPYQDKIKEAKQGGKE